MGRNLRVIYWNPGGIQGKVNDLRLLAQSQDAHIILLGETKLTSNRELRLPNFFVYRRDEVSRQGMPYRGTAVLVRRDLIHEELDLPPFSSMRSIGVRVKSTRAELRLYAAYRPPGETFCPSDIRTVLDGCTPTLVAGDLNAKHPAWGSRVITPAGRRLLEDSEANNYEVLGPDEPTHVPSNTNYSPDVLDVVLCQELPCPVHVEVLYDMNTQHLPILITLGLAADFTAARAPRPRVNWSAYQSALTDLTLGGPVSTVEDVEAAASYITERIQLAKEAASSNPPAVTCRRDELPANLRFDLQRKRRLHRLWARTRCPRVKRELNCLAAELAEGVRKYRGATWESLIDRVGEHETSLHHLNRQLTRAAAPVCPLIDSTGRRCYAAKDRAEILAEHLEGQFTPHPAAAAVAEHHQEVERRVCEFLSAPLPPLRGEDFISPAELRKVAGRLSRRKAPEPDGIPTAAIIQLPKRGLVSLCRLFNGILRTGHFPSAWKVGKVIVLPKPGKDRRDPSSYRPITLLSHIAKLFERLLLRRLRPHFPIRDEQFGFRDQHSTTLQLARVLHHLASERNQDRYTVGVFLDVEKAFDRVWYPGLIFKLLETSTPPAIVRIVASFLEGRTFRVSVEDVDSQSRPIRAGVPQGSCLSPCLYAAYTNDIPTLRGQLQEWEEDVMLALFADDSAFFASSNQAVAAAKKMQKLLDLLPEWLDKWRMAVNVGKTAALLTGLQRILPPKLQLRGQDVEWNSSVRYLGCHIDRSLRMVPQVDHLVRQAKAARAMLRPVLASRLPLRARLRIYKTYVRSRLTYAAPAWYALCSATQRRRLQVQQNIALRVIVGAGRYVRNDVIARDVQMPSVEEFVVQLARRMFDRADNGPHEHLQNIAPLHARPPEGRPLPRELLRSPPN